VQVRALQALFLVGLVVYALYGVAADPDPAIAMTSNPTPGTASIPSLLTSRLRAVLLMFGGAYIVFPVLQRDAVIVGACMTNLQFLDGIALSRILPAPLIIFSTFVGYFGGRPLGALAVTFGIFLPAFAFTLVGHEYLERLIANPSVHTFLDGVTAGWSA
jgi:chromate transporter